jgi:hypothetical protein
VVWRLHDQVTDFGAAVATVNAFLTVGSSRGWKQRRAVDGALWRRRGKKSPQSANH